MVQKTAQSPHTFGSPLNEPVSELDARAIRQVQDAMSVGNPAHRLDPRWADVKVVARSLMVYSD